MCNPPLGAPIVLVHGIFGFGQLKLASKFKPPRVLGVPVGVLSLTHDIVRNKEGDNDGAVSVESARFGQRQENWTFLEIWPGNHFRIINWGTNILLTPSEENDNTIVEKYTALAARLRNLPSQ